MKQAPAVTQHDLVKYGTFTILEEIPENYEKLISLASDIVMYAVKNNYKPTSEVHVLAVKKAICSQVSYWFETGTNPLNEAVASSYSLGELSVSMDTNSSSHSDGYSLLCPMAKMHLNSAYLLYRGLRRGRA